MKATGFVLGMLLVVAIAYQPAWTGAPVWDDDAHLTRSDLQSTQGLARIWTDVGATQQYYPVTHTVFWIEHRVWGETPLGYHLVNITLHAVSVGLFVLLLRRWRVPGALLAGALFAVHPLNVESVAWMTELKNTLSGVLYLSAALMYDRFSSRRTFGRYLAATVLFILALGAKTVTATLPVSLLIVAWWRFGRVDVRRDIVPLAPWIAIAGSAGLMTAWVERTFIIGYQTPEVTLTAIERMLVAGRAVFFYAGKLVWPSPLILVYPRWEVNAAVWWQYLFPIGVLLAGTVAWMTRRRSRAGLAVLLCFVAALLPALGFVDVFPFRFSFVADHFAYLAAMPALAATAAVLTRLASHAHLRSSAARASASAMMCAVLMMLTWQHSRVFANEETLYRATIAANPTCWMAYANLGVIELDGTSERFAAGVDHIQTALRLNPGNAEAHNSLGFAWAKAQRFQEALAEHQEALRLLPGFLTALSNLGADLQALGRLDEAAAVYRDVLVSKPSASETRRNLGLVLQAMGRHGEGVAEIERASSAGTRTTAASYESFGLSLQKQGKLNEAIRAYREALRLTPDAFETHNNLGLALDLLGRTEEAAAEFNESLRLNPNGARTHDNLGFQLFRAKHAAEAIGEFERAVALDPAYADAHYHLANALESVGRFRDAIPHYRATIAIAPTSAEAHNNLGIALAELGRIDEAIAAFKEALRLAPDFATARNNLGRATQRR